MAKECRPQGARVVLVALFGLSAFLVCMLLPHHSHSEVAPAGAGAAAQSGSAAHAHAVPSSSDDCAPKAGDSSPGGDGGSPNPVCHNAATQVADSAKRVVPAHHTDVLGLLGIAVPFVVRPGLAPNSRWTALPSQRLSGSSLLTTIGVSRI